LEIIFNKLLYCSIFALSILNTGSKQLYKYKLNLKTLLFTKHSISPFKSIIVIFWHNTCIYYIMETPTELQYNAFQNLYNYFNEKLFEGKLFDCFFTFSRDGLHAIAVFRDRRWFNDAETIYNEISINPRHMLTDNPKKLCSTIVHEMCHAWQQQYGKPGRSAYHNKEWVNRMEKVGLKPHNNKHPNIKTGDSVSHSVIPGGQYEKAFNLIPKEILLPFSCIEALRKTFTFTDNQALSYDSEIKKLPEVIKLMITNHDPVLNPPVATKVKYSCGCPGKDKKNFWGKPRLEKIYCDDCEESFIASDGTD